VTHDALDIRDDLGWWIVGFDSDAGLGRVNGTGGTVERDAVGGPANVGGAEVEGFAGDVNLDGVEKTTVEDLDADDMGVLRGNELLHEGDRIQAEGESVGNCGGLQGVDGVKAGNTSAAAANVGLTTMGQRRPSVAATAWDARWMTRALG